MTPLMDAIFILLIFFLYAILQMTVDKGVQVDLPKASAAPAAAPAKEVTVVIGITAGGDTYFNKEKIAPDRLYDRIMAEKKANKNGIVIYLRGDKKAYHAQTVNALDAILRAGVRRVFFQVAG